MEGIDGMKIKRIAAFILVLILGLSIIACGRADSEDTVVAKSNGQKLTKGEFNEGYEQVKQSYFITEEMENDQEQQEAIAQIKAEVLEQLIMQKLLTQKAEDAGFVVNDDILDQARLEFENIIAELAAQMEMMDSGDAEQEEDAGNQDKDY